MNLRLALALLLLTLHCTCGHAQINELNTKYTVMLADGEKVNGKLLEYVFGEKVVLVLDDGDVRVLQWQEVRRLTAVETGPDGDGKETKPDTLAKENTAPEIDRPWRHQVTGGLNFGRAFGPFDRVNIYGYSLSYHYVRPVGPVLLGLGLDGTLFSYSRGENVLALSALVEYQLLRNRRGSPYLRLEGGPSLPFGRPGDEARITNPGLGYLIHPSVGYVFGPNDRTALTLFVDVGYRFANANFTLEPGFGDGFLRRTEYQRFCLRGGLRF